MISILFAFTLLSLCGCIDGLGLRKTVWTVPEVKEWYADYRKNDRYAWDGILYRGSDAEWHYFIAHVLSVDDWAIIRIRVEDLSLPDERLFNATSSGPYGYYYVDPSRDFVKIRDY